MCDFCNDKDIITNKEYNSMTYDQIWALPRAFIL